MVTYRRSRSPWAVVTVMVTLLAALAGATCAFAAAPDYPEDEVEAAFLYRFASFVQWPPSAVDQPSFKVAVLGDDAVAGDLERMLAHEKLKGRPVQVLRISSIDQLGGAQILYIGDSDESTLKRRLTRIAGRPVLVVTSQPGALDDGSTINFLLIDHHVRFEISLATAQRSGLIISADLLSVATHVEGRPIGSEAPCEIVPQVQPQTSCAPRLAAE